MLAGVIQDFVGAVIELDLEVLETGSDIAERELLEPELPGN